MYVDVRSGAKVFAKISNWVVVLRQNDTHSRTQSINI